MQGATVKAERKLRARMRDAARRQLGSDADEKAVDELADRLYEGPRHKDAGKRTPWELRQENRMRQATRNAIDREAGR